MKRVIAWLLQPLVIGSLGLLALSALIWWVGPLIGIGDARPLAPPWVRVLLLALLWGLWIARLAWLAWRRRQLHKALVQGLGADANAADHEAKLLAQRVDEAMARLRTASKRSLLAPAAYLYELPWYMFIGAPGSGKTTALLHAGLQFLLDDAAQGKPVAGVGGTRNCDWWFTRDAVLIDTAGRYAMQESDAAVDASAWKAFLGLLRRTRPRQPLNGVLLTLSVQDLLTQSSAERQAQAVKLRSRLAELQTELGMAPPVYVLLTKTDLLAGFNESFGDWSREQRDQVWGFTLPYPGPTAPADLLAAFDAAYRQLEQRLADGLPERLQQLRQPEQRTAAFGFPQQLALLRPLLRDSLATIFAAGGGLERTPQVRGVYLSSGTQEGTPIDRLMGQLGRAFGLDRSGQSLLAGGQGKSFFLLGLLRDVVFAERGLGAWNAAAERRRRLLRWSGLGAIALISLLLLGGWATSYVRNQAYAREVAARLPQIRQQLEALPAAPAGDLSLLLQPLGELRAAAQPTAWRAEDPPLSTGLGLSQFDKLDAGARIAYEHALQTAFAPRIAQRLEDRLRAANRDNLENAYEALKSYLMLYQPEHFDADALRAWIGVDWDQQYAALDPQQRARLDAQLDDWLKLGAPPALRAQDAQLVAGVREMLAAFPLEHRVYNRLKRSSRGQDLPDFTVAGAAGPRAAQVLQRTSGRPLSQGVTGLFTRDGYRRTFQQSVATASTQLAAEEGWVLGLRRDAAAMKDLMLGSQVADRVRRLYLEEYIQVWDALLQDVRVQPLGDLGRSIEISRILAGVDSPLSAFVRRAAEETTLVQAPAAPATGALGAAAEAAKKARDDAARLADAGPAGPAGGAGGPPERIVDEHFAALRRAAAASDETRKLFEEINTQLLAIDAAQKSKSPPPPGGGAERIKAAAGQQPEPVRSMLEALADAGAKSSRGAERDVLTAELQPITEFCQRAVANRYPFAPSSRADVMPEDFGQLFGAGGMLDDFYQRRLASLVDTGQRVWAYKPLPDGTRPPSPAALAEFQRASRIREVFFRAGGRAPGFRIDLRLGTVDGGLKELQLDLDGQVLKLTPGGPAVTLSWPSQRVASQLKLNTQPALAQPLQTEGPWALFRLFDRFELQPAPQPERFTVLMQLEGRKAQLEVTATSVFNPFRLRELQQFRCPGAM